MKLTYFFKPPCPKCPYILGRVHSLVNPCPQCKENGYQFFKKFLSEDVKVIGVEKRK